MTDLDVDQAGGLLEMPRSERVDRLFGFEPFDYQKNVLDAEAPRKLWVCGRQVGKTETASVVPADHALMNPGEDVLIAAKFQETANELFRRTKAHLEGMGPLEEIGVTTPNKSTYEFDTGSRIMARTLGTRANSSVGRSRVVSWSRRRHLLIARSTIRSSDRCSRPMTITSSC